MPYPLYSDLKTITKGINRYIDSMKYKDLFLTAYSALYLLGDPLFEFSVQDKRSVQTFYANHYLRECIGLEALPEKEKLKRYYNSEEFKVELIKLYNKIIDDNKIRTERLNYIKDINLRILFKSIKDLCEDVFIGCDAGIVVTPYRKASDEILESLKTDGYYVFENFFESSYFKKLEAKTKEIASNESNDVGYFYGQNERNQRVYNLISKDKVFVDFINCSFIHDLCNRYFDRATYHDKYGMNSFSANIIHSGGSSGAWHIDSVLPDPIPTEYPIRLQIIISIDEFTKENGSTAVVPKTHRLGRRPNAQDLELISGEEKVICCPKGSMLIFNSSLWHKNTENKTDYSRHSLLASFAASYFMEVCGEEEHLSIVPKEVIDKLPDRIKSMIGYQRAIKKGALIQDRI